MTEENTIRVGRRTLRLSNLGKVLYPQIEATKADVIEYYAGVANTILPYLKDRPVTLKRYPNGVAAPFFYEKRCPEHRPPWVKTAMPGADDEDDIKYCLVQDVATLIWLANLAAIELHPLLARAKRRDRPDWIVFDLDPGAPAGMVQCCKAALALRDLLDHIGLKSFAKTSGSKGLHMLVPLNTKATFDQTKSLARSLAQTLERHDSSAFTSVMRKELRKGKIFIDWSQNDFHKTTACPYTLRATATMGVSAPLLWEEVEHAAKSGDASPLQLDPKAVLARIERIGDPLEAILKLKQPMPADASL